MIKINQMMAIAGVIIAVTGTVFWVGWDVSVVAENVKFNTKEIGLQKAVDIDMAKWKVGHETLFIEQVFKAQAREQRVRVLEKTLDTKLDQILEKVSR